MTTNLTVSASDAVREYTHSHYVDSAKREGLATFKINVGEVHRALELRNRVPLVCQALKSRKFLDANALRLISESGPASGQSTTVTYTYEFADRSPQKADPWGKLRGALKDVFADLGGGEAYLQKEREQFSSSKDGR
jgi:hypothetical protein